MPSGKLQVYAERCDQCLFGPNRIVSGSRAASVIQDCLKHDSYFICHKASNRDETVVCRGFYETQTCNLIRIAQRLGVIAFVPVPMEQNGE